MAEVTNSLAQQARDRDVLEMSKLSSGINLLVSISEVLAWMTLGHTLIYQVFFSAWAVVMVRLRPYFAIGAANALARGQIREAESAQRWFKVCMVFTAFSLFMLFIEAMERYQEVQRAQDPAVMLAKSRVDEAQNALEELQSAHSHLSLEQIVQAVATKEQLDSELRQAITEAQNAFAAKVSQVNKRLKHFWNTRHSSGITVQQVMDEHCNPKRSPYGGGLMKSAAQELCPRLKAIQAQMPKVADDVKVQRIRSEIAALQPILSYKFQLENAQDHLKQAEAKWLQRQAEVKESHDYLPPAFVQASEFLTTFGVSISPEKILWVFVMVAIVTVLHGQSYLKILEPMLRMPLPREVPDLAPRPSWWERLMGWLNQGRESSKVPRDSEPQRQKKSQPEINLPEGALGVTAQSVPPQSQGFIGFVPPQDQMDIQIQSVQSSDNFCEDKRPSEVGDHLIPTDETLRDRVKEFNKDNYRTVISFLEKGITSPSEIAKQTGINRSSVYRYRDRYLKSQELFHSKRES